MNKVIFGAAMGLSLIGMADRVEAQLPEAMCDPVFDESSSGVTDDLQDVIDDYAGDGIDVHVQIVNRGADYGIDHEGDAGRVDAEAFTDQLAEECEWNQDEVVSVVVSGSPRVYYAYAQGNSVDEVRDNFQGAFSSFEDDLRDDSEDSPKQDDIANFLQEVRNPSDDGASYEVLVGVLAVAIVIGGITYFAMRNSSGGGFGSGNYSSGSSYSAPYTSFGSSDFGGGGGFSSGGDGGGY